MSPGDRAVQRVGSPRLDLLGLLIRQQAVNHAIRRALPAAALTARSPPYGPRSRGSTRPPQRSEPSPTPWCALLIGAPLHSDGKLTIVSLAAEADLRRNKLTHKHTGLKDLF